MKQFSKETRQRMSEAAQKRCNEQWRKQQSERLAVPLDESLVRTLYDSGMTQKEIADQLGTTQKVIFGFMRRRGIKSRPAIKRDQTGEKNDSWRGSDAGYAAFHLRIESLRGKPQQCEECGATDATRTYDWACMTGQYDNPSDYKRLCRSCHWKHDQKCRNLGQYAMRKGGGINDNSR